MRKSYVIYTGQVPNQQIEPSINWLRSRYPGKPFFLMGSDYVYPRTINSIIRSQLKQSGLLRGENYIPLGIVEVAESIAKIRKAMPNGGIIFNTLDGDTNVAFFKVLVQQNMTPKKYPVLSVNIAEEEVMAIGAEYVQGHYAAWSYFQTVNTPTNRH